MLRERTRERVPPLFRGKGGGLPDKILKFMTPVDAESLLTSAFGRPAVQNLKQPTPQYTYYD